MKERTTDFTVGIFVMIGLILLSIMVVKFGNYSYTEKHYELISVFKFTNGVVVGAPVRCAGVEVGKVQELRFSEKKEFGVDVVCSLKSGTVIRKDALVVINSLGIMGEKYVEFLPQSITSPVLSDGDVIRGVDPVAMSEIMQEGRDIAQKVDDVIADWNNEKMQEKVKQAVTNIENITNEETQESVKAILDNVETITGSPNKENIERAIKNFREFSENANRVTMKIEGIVDANEEFFKTFGKDFSDAINSFKNVVNNIEKGEGTVGQLIKDDEIGKDIKDFIKDIKANPWKLFIRGKEKKPSTNKQQQQKVFGIF
ncbi:MAG: MlaD family protein [Candidatus Ancaeobacter aquaticus]|nr:MlaD family protein [Candidatus Ancaeobacter aquaticus]